VSPHPLGSRTGSDAQRVARKLEEVGQAMDSITTQKVPADFFKVPENAQKLNVLVEDVRHALIDYQVRTPKTLTRTYLISTADIIATGHLR